MGRSGMMIEDEVGEKGFERYIVQLRGSIKASQRRDDPMHLGQLEALLEFGVPVFQSFRGVGTRPQILLKGVPGNLEETPHKIIILEETIKSQKVSDRGSHHCYL